MMAKRIFVDSWAWIALADADDPQYRQALGVLKGLKADGVRLATTNVVICESWENLRRRFGLAAALRFYHYVEDISTKPGTLDIISVNAHDERDALRIARHHDDQDLSMVDCLSLAVMRQLGPHTAFTGDWHFTLLGFSAIPQISRS